MYLILHKQFFSTTRNVVFFNCKWTAENLLQLYLKSEVYYLGKIQFSFLLLRALHFSSGERESIFTSEEKKNQYPILKRVKCKCWGNCESIKNKLVLY